MRVSLGFGSFTERLAAGVWLVHREAQRAQRYTEG
jgi:hypothetical protein